MIKTKYFVIHPESPAIDIRVVTDTLNDARKEAERQAIAYPGQRFLIAAEVQSVVVQTQVNWTDK